tara:strand:+ start:2251 stop:3042 length:792 start_codon:yes stop_codon:yes gene_type:complete
MRNTLLLLLGTIFLTGCEIREEMHFNADGSGSYEIGFDMSEMMKMGNGSDSVPPSKSIDTLINFAEFLDRKKDSIAQLPKGEQDKLEAMRPLRFSMKVNDEQQQMDMRLGYAFETLDDISKFAEAVKTANIKELDQIMDPMSNMTGMSAEPDTIGQKQDGLTDFFSMSKSFNTTFNASGFSRTITQEAIVEMQKKKDTTLQEDDPFANMIRFKQVYKFPFRVKSVSNPHAKILSDFKGVELEANMYEANNDPEFFNIEVVFEQ